MGGSKNNTFWNYPVHGSNKSYLKKPTTFKKGANYKYVGSHRRDNDRVFSQYQVWADAGPFRPAYYNSNKHNEEQALWKRVLSETEPIDKDLEMEFLEFAKANVFKLFPKKKIKSDTIGEYLKMSNASPQVKKQIFMAHEELVSLGINQRTKLNYRQLYKWTTRKSFVKVENQCLQGLLGKTGKAPRLIQGAQPQFIALVGPFISRVQRHLKNHMDENSFCFYPSGSSAETVANRVVSFGDWQIFESDVSAFDSSVSVAWCKFECWLTQQLGAPRAVVDLMLANINTHGYTSCGFKYSVPGTRKSGDPYTSCYNTLLNIMLHLFAFCTKKGCDFETAKSHLFMVAMGDDNLLRHSGPRLELGPIIRRLGFKTVCTYRSHLYDAEFCSSIIIPVKSGFCFVPKPGRIACKMGYFINPPLNVHPMSLMKGYALGMGSLLKLPVFEDLLLPILSKTLDYTTKYLRDTWEFKMKIPQQYPVPDTIVWLSDRYLVRPSEVSQLCNNREYNRGFELLADRDTDAERLYYCHLIN